jgi:hypothetical protein
LNPLTNRALFRIDDTELSLIFACRVDALFPCAEVLFLLTEFEDEWSTTDLVPSESVVTVVEPECVTELSFGPVTVVDC